MGDAKHQDSGSVHPDPHLAHHFDSPSQQFTASKLGMWLFIATELLMFGGLFCAYAVYRASHPEIFAWGSQFLDRTWGLINTFVLIFSSLTMALAVRAAQCGQKRQLVLFLTLTLVCGADFLVVKYIEYSHKFEEHLVWGKGFYEGEHGQLASTGAGAGAAVELASGDAAKGAELFGKTCAACHGAAAEGLPFLGPALTANTFVGGLDEAGLVAFVRVGRSMSDPLNKTGLLMPPRGGNPGLSDQALADIAAHVLTLQGEAVSGDVLAAAPDAVATEAAAAPEPPSAVPAEPIARSLVSNAPTGPTGLAPTVMQAGLAMPTPAARGNVLPQELPVPENAHIFFAIYFCMTGLHGVHVLIGLAIITWLRVRAVKGDFGTGYYTPVDLGGLFWHLVDVIWIFLFPLLYLI